MKENKWAVVIAGVMALTLVVWAQETQETDEVQKVVTAEQAEPVEKKEITLSKDLMPIFVRSCKGCHQRKEGNEHAIEKKIFYETHADVTNQVGKLIIPGAPEKSHLVWLITPPENPDQRKEMMPPTRSKAQKLSKEEIKKVSEWIKAGAKNN